MIVVNAMQVIHETVLVWGTELVTGLLYYIYIWQKHIHIVDVIYGDKWNVKMRCKTKTLLQGRQSRKLRCKTFIYISTVSEPYFGIVSFQWLRPTGTSFLLWGLWRGWQCCCTAHVLTDPLCSGWGLLACQSIICGLGRLAQWARKWVANGLESIQRSVVKMGWEGAIGVLFILESGVGAHWSWSWTGWC